jgi:DNA-binding NarL/FixJ family response regulator
MNSRARASKRQEESPNPVASTFATKHAAPHARRHGRVPELGGVAYPLQEPLPIPLPRVDGLAVHKSDASADAGSAKDKDRISVLVITGDSMTSELLKNAFQHGRKGFRVETLTGSSHDIIAKLEAHRADIALISEALEDGPEAGIRVLQKAREICGTRVIMLLASSAPDRVVNAFRGGARGVFHRSHPMKALSKCIQAVHQGQIWVGNQDIEHILNTLTHVRPIQIRRSDGMPLLTPREEEVVRLVADGLKNWEIAQRLKVKEHSVRNYIYRIFEKLGVSNRVELILYAFSRRDGAAR